VYSFNAGDRLLPTKRYPLLRSPIRSEVPFAVWISRTNLRFFTFGARLRCERTTHNVTLGAFGATAAAAKLLALNADAVANAIAITASLCAGIRVNFGTMTKPLHVDRAAQNGVFAAELALRGFTAGREGLDGRWGFFQIFGLGGEAEPARISGTLGNP